MENVSLEQALSLVAWQNSLNCLVDPHWAHTHYPYLRGILVETAEAMDHYGWKWWTLQVADLQQFQYELMDILSFLLCHLISENQSDLHQAARALVSQSDPAAASYGRDLQMIDLRGDDVLRLLEQFAGLAVFGVVALPVLERILRLSGLHDWDSVLAKFRQKQALHAFRQLNGYRSGTYRKVWRGKEDSVHLAELLQGQSNDIISSELHQALSALYSQTSFHADATPGNNNAND